MMTACLSPAISPLHRLDRCAGVLSTPLASVAPSILENSPQVMEDETSAFEAPQLRKRPRSHATEADTASSGSTVAAVADAEGEPRPKRRRRTKGAKEAADSEGDDAGAESDASSSAPKRSHHKKGGKQK